MELKKDKMGLNNLQDNKILFIHCSITCVHCAGLLLFIYFNEHLHSIGLYKYLLILMSIFVIDLIKLLLTSSQLDQLLAGKQESNHAIKSKKSNGILKNIFKSIAASIVLTIIYYIIVVLFGAPLFIDCGQTLLLASTLTMLTLVLASLHIGIDNSLAILVGYPMQVSGAVIDAIKLNIKAVLFGTWISAFVFPLDWGRPWQAWPIPCLVGALLGYFASNAVTFANVLFFKLKKSSKRTTLKNC